MDLAAHPGRPFFFAASYKRTPPVETLAATDTGRRGADPQRPEAAVAAATRGAARGQRRAGARPICGGDARRTVAGRGRAARDGPALGRSAAATPGSDGPVTPPPPPPIPSLLPCRSPRRSPLRLSGQPPAGRSCAPLAHARGAGGAPPSTAMADRRPLRCPSPPIVAPLAPPAALRSSPSPDIPTATRGYH